VHGRDVYAKIYGHRGHLFISQNSIAVRESNFMVFLTLISEKKRVEINKVVVEINTKHSKIFLGLGNLDD
jgi:hypothetical protein